jgi:hypothetical protein
VAPPYEAFKVCLARAGAVRVHAAAAVAYLAMHEAAPLEDQLHLDSVPVNKDRRLLVESGMFSHLLAARDRERQGADRARHAMFDEVCATGAMYMGVVNSGRSEEDLRRLMELMDITFMECAPHPQLHPPTLQFTTAASWLLSRNSLRHRQALRKCNAVS